MHVAQLWRYPVKSMIGEVVDSVELAERGVVGDRSWAARDLERGGIRGAKKLGGLMRFAAQALDGDGDGTSAGVIQHVEITLPDGSTTSTVAPDRDDVLSAALGHPIRLESLRPADDLDHYRRGAPDSDDMLVELRAVFGREEGEPLPDLSQFPPEIIEFESPPGTHHDAHPLLVMTETALAALADAVPDAAVDVRRFRPSIVVGGADGEGATTAGHPEFDWVGRRASIGDAEIEFVGPCPRCVMVTREIDAATPADRSILRHVVRDLDQNVGVYATVTRPGTVRTGDALVWS